MKSPKKGKSWRLGWIISQAEEFLALAEQTLGPQPPATDQSEVEDLSELG